MTGKITNPLHYRALFLSYQRVDLLEKSLRSFFESSASFSQVVVLDNGSSASDIAKLRNLASELGGLKLIEIGDNIGGEAFNGELEKLDEDWVLLAENDMVFQPGWEDAFARAIQAFPDLGQISPLAVVPGDDEVWDPHHFVARENDGVVIHERERGNVGTTCLLRGDLVRTGLRVHNLSNDGPIRLPNDMRLSRDVRERGFRVANLGRAWVHNLGHSEQEFSQREDYYRKNYAAKPIGEDGWQARRERFESRTTCPDRTMRIGKLDEQGMSCWMPYLDRMNLESRQWTMLDGGNPEVEGLEWLAAKIRLEKPQLVIITPNWDGTVKRVCKTAIQRNGCGQVIAVDGELDLNQITQKLGADPARALLVCCGEALENPFSIIHLNVPENWGAAVVFGKSASHHLNFEGSSKWRCIDRGLPRGLAEWQNLGSAENSNTGEGEKRTAVVEQ